MLKLNATQRTAVAQEITKKINLEIEKSNEKIRKDLIKQFTPTAIKIAKLLKQRESLKQEIKDLGGNRLVFRCFSNSR